MGNKIKMGLKINTCHQHTADTVPIHFPQVNMKMEYQKKQMEKGVSPAKASIALSAHQKKCVQGVLKEQWVSTTTRLCSFRVKGPTRSCWVHDLHDRAGYPAWCLCLSRPGAMPNVSWQPFYFPHRESRGPVLTVLCFQQGWAHCWHDEANQGHQEPFQLLRTPQNPSFHTQTGGWQSACSSQTWSQEKNLPLVLEKWIWLGVVLFTNITFDPARDTIAFQQFLFCISSGEQLGYVSLGLLSII